MRITLMFVCKLVNCIRQVSRALDTLLQPESGLKFSTAQVGRIRAIQVVVTDAMELIHVANQTADDVLVYPVQASNKCEGVVEYTILLSGDSIQVGIPEHGVHGRPAGEPGVIVISPGTVPKPDGSLFCTTYVRIWSEMENPEPVWLVCMARSSELYCGGG